jgi:hypothetical protein
VISLRNGGGTSWQEEATEVRRFHRCTREKGAERRRGPRPHVRLDLAPSVRAARRSVPDHEHPVHQEISTRRVMCPLLSQYVLRLARNGSFGAGWMFPWMSKARDVTRCSPAVGFPQSNVQNLHA